MARIGPHRREVLAALGAAGVLGACGPAEEKPKGRKPTAQERAKIETIVICMMENRSFDHVFGSLSLLEGRTEVDGLRPSFSNRDVDGNEIGPTPTEAMCTPGDPPHGWDSSRVQFDGGTNAGFVRAWEDRHGVFEPQTPMTYLTREQQPVSYALADGSALCQRWFSAVLTSTWPNRLYFHATQSQGETSNDLPLPEGKYTCKAIWDQLTEAGISWGYYFTDLPTLALFGREDWAPHIHVMADFYKHAAEGTLPQVVCVEPGAGYNDDHPPHHPMLGQLFLGSVYEALAQSPHWDRCLFLYTYDEAGGFYDHVAPGLAADDRADLGFDQLGFRVPAVVTGPFVKNVVSDTVFEHAAVARFIQDHFGITERLTLRNEAAADLSELLDAELLERAEPQPPIVLPEFRQTAEEVEQECRKVQARTNQPELRAAVRALWPHLDLTDDLPRHAREAWAQARRLGLWKPRA